MSVQRRRKGKNVSILIYLLQNWVFSFTKMLVRFPGHPPLVIQYSNYEDLISLYHFTVCAFDTSEFFSITFWTPILALNEKETEGELLNGSKVGFGKNSRFICKSSNAINLRIICSLRHVLSPSFLHVKSVIIFIKEDYIRPNLDGDFWKVIPIIIVSMMSECIFFLFFCRPSDNNMTARHKWE